LTALRAKFHFEIAKTEIASDFLQKAAMHVNKALALDYGAVSAALASDPVFVAAAGGGGKWALSAVWVGNEFGNEFWKRVLATSFGNEFGPWFGTGLETMAMFWTNLCVFDGCVFFFLFSFFFFLSCSFFLPLFFQQETAKEEKATTTRATRKATILMRCGQWIVF